MSASLAPRHPRLFRVYYAAVVAAAVVAFVAFTPSAGRVPPATAIVVLLLMGFSEATAVPL
ncbi:MAG: hypothetical protein HY076_08690, partial [Candidatus Eisenbacteria bacterium]|nr:hypothetical protein [Candidatus Eisenbacteria bacterium]